MENCSVRVHTRAVAVETSRSQWISRLVYIQGGAHRRRGLVVDGDFRCSRRTAVECGPAYELHPIILLLYLCIIIILLYTLSLYTSLRIDTRIYYLSKTTLRRTHLNIVILRLSEKKTHTSCRRSQRFRFSESSVRYIVEVTI